MKIIDMDTGKILAEYSGGDPDHKIYYKKEVWEQYKKDAQEWEDKMLKKLLYGYENKN